MLSKFSYNVEEALIQRPFTNEGGWRHISPYGGAPSDAVGTSAASNAGVLPTTQPISYAPESHFAKPAHGSTMV
ncbi:hypothetical protein QFC24_006520 [Naganishia onofrii]|uniref:Uncharacterized protein n=1 Tax=Naganishia onofrii TaxID=1851511 RepID=A0ACC2X0Y6_9TREE|nr:hypothetical protein QFC24_006520 [Naganishia onofrii]